MTDTTTDAAEARALKACPFCGGDAEFQVDHRRNCIGVGCTRCTANQPPSWDFASKRWAAEAWNNRATAEAASGAGEREIERLKAEVDRWRHKLWMVACHATGGGMPDIEGIDQSTNDISVQITASRNAIYQAGKDAALASLPPATDPAIGPGYVHPENIAEVAACVDLVRRMAGNSSLGRPFAEDEVIKFSSAHYEEARAITRMSLAAAPTIPATGEVIPAWGVSLDEVRRIFAERAFEYATRKGSTGLRPWCEANNVLVSHASDFANGLREPLTDLLAALGLERVARILPIDPAPTPTIPATGHAATEGEGA